MTQHGYFFVADISGFTAYLVRVELQGWVLLWLWICFIRKSWMKFLTRLHIRTKTTWWKHQVVYTSVPDRIRVRDA